MKKIFNIILVSLISLAFFGCASTGKVPEPSVPLGDALSTIENLKHNTPRSMRINSRIDYVDEINAKRVVGQDLILSAQEPSSLRITISAFDKALAALVSDGIAFALMDTSQNVFVTGIASPDNISRILPVFLSASDLYRVIYGLYPVDGLADDFEDRKSFQWDEKNGGYRLSLPMQNGLVENVFYSWPDGDIFKITVVENDKIVYQYEASEFKTYSDDNQSWRFPNQILFSLPVQKTDVRLRVEKRDMNVDFAPAVFRLMPPAGAKIIVLDAPASDANNNASETPDASPHSDAVNSEKTENETSENTQTDESINQMPVQDDVSDVSNDGVDHEGSDAFVKSVG